ncbi:MAG: histidinol phosphatase, partial [Candidatus Poribacteria bacterium]
MGDELPFTDGVKLHAAVPDEAYICLLRDGHVIEEFEGKRLSYAITEPGVYRVEVRQRFKPWIFSNPIYVRTP